VLPFISFAAVSTPQKTLAWRHASALLTKKTEFARMVAPF